MKIFKDSLGREWPVTINYSAQQRVKAALGMDLLNVETLRQFTADPEKFLEVLYHVCKPQLDEKSISKENFLDAIYGDPIEDAINAVLEELSNFFPKGRREILKKLIVTASELEKKKLELIDSKIESGELERLLSTVIASSGSSPASSASTPASIPSASST